MSSRLRTLAAAACLLLVGAPGAWHQWQAGAGTRAELVAARQIAPSGATWRARATQLSAPAPATATLHAVGQAALAQGLQVTGWQATAPVGRPLATEIWTVHLSPAATVNPVTVSLPKLAAALAVAPVALTLTQVQQTPTGVDVTLTLTHAGT